MSSRASSRRSAAKRVVESDDHESDNDGTPEAQDSDDDYTPKRKSQAVGANSPTKATAKADSTPQRKTPSRASAGRKSSGRTPKVESEDVPAEKSSPAKKAGAEEPPAPKRGRGRPKKDRSNEEAKSPLVKVEPKQEKDTAKSPTRSKAAAAKAASPASKSSRLTRKENCEQAVTAPAPRPRGRPKKNQYLDDIEIDEFLKTHDEEADDADDDDDDDDDDMDDLKENKFNNGFERDEREEEDEEESNEPRVIQLRAAGLTNTIELGRGTAERCGQCTGCTREPCQECSSCKRADQDSCIDRYCIEEESGRANRMAIRELYIKSFGGVFDSSTGTITVTGGELPADPQTDTSVTSLPMPTKKGPVEVIANRVHAQNESDEDDDDEDWDADNHGKSRGSTGGKPTRSGQPRRTNYVYGGKHTAAKTRRCGECEGCMKDDCGECLACQDKPRFGGRGTKKRACFERVCIMKAAARARNKQLAQLQGEDHQHQQEENVEMVQEAQEMTV